MMRRIMATVLLAHLAAVPVLASKGPWFVTLKFMPQENVSAPTPETAPGMFSAPFRLPPIKDGRPLAEPAEIGRYEDRRVLTSTRVDWFVSDVVRRCLVEWGMPVNDDAPHVLQGEVVRFNIDVDAMYAASVSVRFTYEDGEGKKIWEGVATGDARQFSMSDDDEDFNGPLSDALKEAVANLLGMPTFQAALTGHREPEQFADEARRPEVLLQEIAALKEEGFSDDMLLSYIRQQTLLVPMSASDLIAWKQAGMSESVIQAAMDRVRKP